MLYFKRITLGLCAVLLFFLALHNVQLYWHSKIRRGPFEYVEVYGEHMHVYDSKTEGVPIILLSGFGTAVPTIDFMPLAKALEDHHRVIILEYLGYGYSDDTKRPRTVEHLTEEIHMALGMLRVDEPYVLMPHSISGIYSHYYAATYPESVAAVIGIDSAVPLQLVGETIPKSSIKESLVRFSGVLRVLSWMGSKALTPEDMAEGYTATDLKHYSDQLIYTFNNTAQRDEMDRYEENGQKALDVKISSSIPMLFFIVPEVHQSPEKWKSDHEETAATQTHGRVIMLQGTHYLHRTAVEAIKKEINAFLQH